MPNRSHPGGNAVFPPLRRRPNGLHVDAVTGILIPHGPGVTECMACGGILRMDDAKGEKCCVRPACEKYVPS